MVKKLQKQALVETTTSQLTKDFCKDFASPPSSFAPSSFRPRVAHPNIQQYRKVAGRPKLSSVKKLMTRLKDSFLSCF